MSRVAASDAEIIERLFSPSKQSVEAAPSFVRITPAESAIYFVAVRGFIKIGWTTNWKSRISSLQVANPEPIEVLLIIGRPQIFEQTMHKQFAAHRAHGEWFRDHDDIRGYIEARKAECWFLAGRRK